MSKRLRSVSLVLAVTAIGLVVYNVLLRQAAPNPPSNPVGVRQNNGAIGISEADRWLPRLRSPGETVFRVEVTSPDAANPADMVVRTLGFLTPQEEENAINSFQLQIRNIDDELQKPDKGGGGLKEALDAASLLWQKERLAAAAQLIRGRQYATIPCNGTRPPDIGNYERIVHGPAGRIQDQWTEMVIYVPTKDKAVAEALEYYNTIYHEYWKHYVDTFNQKSLPDRRVAIDAHTEAERRLEELRRQRVSNTRNAEIEALQAAILKGPFMVDYASMTLKRLQ